MFERQVQALTDSMAENQQESSSTDIDEKLRQFEQLIDKNDPEQVKMLEEMKKHTKMLHQVRGDWNSPNTFRHWNDPCPENVPAMIPLASESYREYKNHVLQEKQSLLEIAAGVEPPRLMGPVEDGQHDVHEPRKLPS